MIQRDFQEVYFMRLKINSCGICDCAPEWQWNTAPHGFSDYDLWAVFRGDGSITPENNSKIHVHEGVCVLLAPNMHYFAEHNPKTPLLTINVHFDFLDENGNCIYPIELKAKSIAFPSFFKEILTRVVSHYNSNRENAACHFLAAALEEFTAAESLVSTQSLGPWTRIINEICTEIDSISKTPTLADFAKKYGYTERYVGKMFAQLKKISFSDYAQNSRISKAKTYLRLSDMSISAIAEELGFYDACHFTRSFQKAVGTSPLAYRKQK